MKVKSVMTKNPITLSVNSTLQNAAEILVENRIDSVPVVNDDNNLLGIFTKTHLFNAVKSGQSTSRKVEEVMDTNIICIHENDDASIIFDKNIEKFPVVNKYNRIVGMITKTDLLKAYYKELKYTTTSINAMLESTSNAIFAIDINGRITFFNKAAENILEKVAVEVIGKEVDEVLIDSPLKEVMEKGEKQIGKKAIFNNKTVIVNRTPIIAGERIIGAVSVFQDITDYKNIVEELDKERNVTEVLRTILDIAYDGIVVVDKNGFITMLSNAYAKFLGTSEAESIGKHVTEVIENTRMHLVVKSGIPEVADLQKIKGNYMIATRIPIIKDGEVSGAVGKVLFRNVNDLDNFYKKINQMEKQLEQYKGELNRINKSKYSFESIIGESEELNRVKLLCSRVALTDSTVLLIGESGTGKELFAHAIHNSSKRADNAFVKVNCAAIPSELLESELFGYEEGSFTGAKKGGKIGKFELAHNGTIFLDEIGDMPIHMQVKLLRVLQEKEIEKIGGMSPRGIDVRVIAATNKNLEQMVKEGSFREDLYYRLNVHSLIIPPLRERIQDIKLLAYHFVDKIGNQYNKYIEKISDRAMDYLQSYSWPGNIRELENVIERSIGVMDRSIIIKLEHLPTKITGNDFAKDLKSLNEILNDAEKQAIMDSLRICENNRSKAAKILNISRSSLYEKMSKYNL